jgi:hypothetical protein
MDDLFLWTFFKLYDARRIHKGLKEKAIIIQLTCLLLSLFEDLSALQIQLMHSGSPPKIKKHKI